MNRKITATVVAAGAAIGVTAGYAAPVIAAQEGRDAPTPGPFNTYVNGTTDGWHYYGNGGIFNSSQDYTYTQTSNGAVNFDQAYWKFDRHGNYANVQFFDSASGIMLDYASYGTYSKSNPCVNQGAYSNVLVTVLTNSYINGEAWISEPSCAAWGGPVGADALFANW